MQRAGNTKKTASIYNIVPFHYLESLRTQNRSTNTIPWFPSPYCAKYPFSSQFFLHLINLSPITHLFCTVLYIRPYSLLSEFFSYLCTMVNDLLVAFFQFFIHFSSLFHLILSPILSPPKLSSFQWSLFILSPNSGDPFLAYFLLSCLGLILFWLCIFLPISEHTPQLCCWSSNIFITLSPQ